MNATRRMIICLIISCFVVRYKELAKLIIGLCNIW